MSTVITIYLAGGGVVALIFVIMLAYLYADGSEDALYILRWYAGLMPEYVIFWPWRCVGFPVWKWRNICGSPRSS